METARVAIVTPYWQEPPALLARCIDSVAQQSVPVDHLLIADGAGQDWLDDTAVRHIRLDRNHGDCGNVARGIGALLAAGEGYGAIGFLDADNRLDPDHVAQCLAARTPGCGLVVARRRFELPDGTPVPAAEESGLVDTNCLFLLPPAYPVIARWALMPRPLAPIGDRIVHAALIRMGLTAVRTAAPTLTYVSRWAEHYRAAGRQPPDDAKALDLDSIATWLAALSPQDKAAAEHLAGVTLKLTG